MSDDVRACLARCRTWIADIEEIGSVSPMADVLLAEIDRLLTRGPMTDTPTPTRYELLTKYDMAGSMIADEHGEWVRWDDLRSLETDRPRLTLAREDDDQ